MSDESVEKALQEGLLTTGNFTIQAVLGKSGRTLTMSGYIYSTNKQKDINDQISMYLDVIDMQQMKSEIPALEALIETKIKANHDCKDSLVELEAKDKKTPAEKAQIIAMKKALIKQMEEIEEGRERLADARKKVKG